MIKRQCRRRIQQLSQMAAISREMAEDADAATGAALLEMAETYQQAIEREGRLLLHTHDTQ
ncbi:multidrug resistance efflux pump [Bradyrhizobium ottawaense]|uniref:hypothetical protein n=1 Tax=Bradyrhizobium ottawaense TaxID=931866 RepID=UPI0035155038